MFISDRMQSYLNGCRKASLQNPIRSFLRVWGDANTPPNHCYNALHVLCRAFDQVGEFHDAESILSAGLVVLDEEPRRRALARQASEQRRRNDRTLLTVGGLVVGGLLLCALTRR